MTFDEIMILCQAICGCLTLSLLCFAIIQYVVYNKAEHKAKMKLFEEELKENKNESDID